MSSSTSGHADLEQDSIQAQGRFLTGSAKGDRLLPRVVLVLCILYNVSGALFLVPIHILPRVFRSLGLLGGPVVVLLAIVSMVLLSLALRRSYSYLAKECWKTAGYLLAVVGCVALLWCFMIWASVQSQHGG